jgi:hypothetical protein
MRTPALLLLAAGALLAADRPRNGPAKEEKTLWASISVNHPVFNEEVQGDPFMMYFALVNDGEKTVNPEADVESSQLLVNGKQFKDWPFTIANGIRDNRWKALPSGDYLSFGYALGRYFKKPGTYKVKWKGKSFESREIEFRVILKNRA